MLKHYLLTFKSNLMKKFKMSGKPMVMVLSLFAFMILGSVSATAQWVSNDEAILLLKNEITTLDDDYAQAQTDEARVAITNAKRYYTSVFVSIAELGQEIPTAIEGSRLNNLAAIHSSGLIYFSKDSPDFKTITQGLVDDVTDLLTD